MSDNEFKRKKGELEGEYYKLQHNENMLWHAL